MYFYLKDTGMVFGVQLLEDHRKKGHFILVVICENRANEYLNLICLSLRFLKRVLISPFVLRSLVSVSNLVRLSTHYSLGNSDLRLTIITITQ